MVSTSRRISIGLTAVLGALLINALLYMGMPLLSRDTAPERGRSYETVSYTHLTLPTN